MASVTSTTVVSDIAEPSGWRYVRYRFDLLDNLGGNHIDYATKLIAAGVDAEADMIAMVPVLLEDKKVGEQHEWRDQCVDGGDPLHWDNGGFWDKTTPLWGTWNEMFSFVAKWFWAREFQLEIAPYSNSWARVNSTDKRNILNITNQDITALNASMQIAIDIQASLDTYVPFFDSNGNVI